MGSDSAGPASVHSVSVPGPEAGGRGRRLGPRSALRWVGLAAVLLILLVPAFQINAFHTTDAKSFAIWQTDSESLVTAKIESTTAQARARGINALGMLYATPDPMEPNGVLDTLDDGARPTTTRYNPYQSQIGFPGYFFTALYHLGFHSIASLQAASSSLFVATLLVFGLLLGRAVRPAFAVVFLIVAIASPWLTLAGRNLYWVPWTWFLPACAALLYCRAGTPRGRRWSLVALAASFFLRWASGYEFITSITLLAMAMPVLIHAFAGTLREKWRTVLAQALVIMAIAVGCFVVSVLLLAFLVGAGDFAYGMSVILFDAGKRTYGGVHVQDPVLAASLAANPLDVVATYLFDWKSDLLTLGTGSPFSVSIGSNGLWLLVVLAAAVVGVRRWRMDGLWTRDAWTLGIAMVVPLSWVVAAKAHAYVHPFIDFVLWYLITVAALVWIVGAFALPEARSLLRRVVAGPASGTVR
jgi:hypothetical protein